MPTQKYSNHKNITSTQISEKTTEILIFKKIAYELDF